MQEPSSAAHCDIMKLKKPDSECDYGRQREGNLRQREIQEGETALDILPKPIGRCTFSGDNMLEDAIIRLERAKFYPKNKAMRQLYLKVQITEWLAFYPKPLESNENYSEWLENSRFSAEEEAAGISPILIKFFHPIWAHAITHLGKDVENQKQPFGKASHVWYLVGSTATRSDEGVVRLAAECAGVDPSVLLETFLEKNAILGAVLFGPDNPDHESLWKNKDYGSHAWTIYGSIRWKFQDTGPPPLFKNVEANAGKGCSILLQQRGTDRIQAIRKKLSKSKYHIILVPGTGEVFKGVPKANRTRKRKRKHARIRNANNENLRQKTF